MYRIFFLKSTNNYLSSTIFSETATLQSQFCSAYLKIGLKPMKHRVVSLNKAHCRHRNFVKVAWHCFSLISPKLLTLLTSTYFSEPQIPNSLWPLNKKLKFQVASDSKLLPKLVNKNKPRKNTHNVHSHNFLTVSRGDRWLVQQQQVVKLFSWNQKIVKLVKLMSSDIILLLYKVVGNK